MASLQMKYGPSIVAALGAAVSFAFAAVLQQESTQSVSEDKSLTVGLLTELVRRRKCLLGGVCLLTGFSPVTRDALIDALDWRPLIDLALSPADAGRGRPWPDLPLTALLRLGGGAVTELATIGDTPSDVESGLRAGAGIAAGVLTGSASREELTRAGATHVLDTVAGLPPLLGL